MESAVFYLNSEELDTHFVEGVKSFFKNRRIKVTVTEELTESSDEALSETQLLKVVERNRATPFHYDVPNQDFKNLVAQFRADDDFDIAEALEFYKTDK
jgi:hypothetical protein